MDPFSMMGLLGGASSLAGGLVNRFGSKKNPNDSANQYLNQIPGAMKPYYQPYMDAGGRALNNLEGEYGNMTNDPGGMIGKLGAGYKESPGYKYALQQAMNAGTNASASGGMLGTPQNQEQQMGTAQGLASQDYEKYLNHVLGLHSEGLAGQQGIENQGYGANTDYANMLGSVLGQQGQNSYNSTQGQNQANAQNWSNIFGGLAGMGTGYFTGQL